MSKKFRATTGGVALLVLGGLGVALPGHAFAGTCTTIDQYGNTVYYGCGPDDPNYPTQTVPAMPAPPTAVATSSTTASVTVQTTAAPDGSPVTGYYVLVDQEGKQYTSTSNVVNIPDLTPGDTYTFTAGEEATNANNDAGDSPGSASSAPLTMPGGSTTTAPPSQSQPSGNSPTVTHVSILKERRLAKDDYTIFGTARPARFNQVITVYRSQGHARTKMGTTRVQKNGSWSFHAKLPKPGSYSFQASAGGISAEHGGDARRSYKIS